MLAPGRFRFALPVLLWCVFTAVRPAFVRADTPVNITITSDVTSVQADGHSQANLSVQAWVDQTLYSGAVQVLVQSSMGSIEPANLSLNNGTAWTHLKAGAGVGLATITVQVVSGPHQVVLPNPLVIEFVAPGTAAAPVVNRRFMSIRAADLTYSLISNRVAALQRVHFLYQNLDIKAESLVFDLNTMELRAQSLSSAPIVIKCRGQTVNARRLYVNFTYNLGIALVVNADNSFSLNSFPANSLTMHKIPAVQPRDAFVMPDEEDDPVLIRARKMDIYPGNEIHCAGVSFYVGGRHTLSLPFYRLSLNPNNPGNDQYISYDTYTGLGINVPFYYMMTDGGMGSIRLTRQDRTGFFGTDTQGGWALGIQQDYGQSVSVPGLPPGSGGSFTLDRITTPDWGLSWKHNEHFSTAGLFNTYLYSPDHRAFTGNISLYSPFHGLGLSLTSFANHQEGANSANSQLSVDLPQQSILRRRVAFNFSGTMAMQYALSTADTGSITQTQWTPGVGVNVAMAPWVFDKSTTVVPSVASHYFYTSSGGYQSTNAGVSMNRLFARSGSLGLTYNWSMSGSTPGIVGYSTQNLSASFFKSFGSRLHVSASPSYSLTASTLYANSSMAYTLSRIWTLDLLTQITTGYPVNSDDWQVGISRLVFGRNIRLYYQGLTHKVRFEITAGQIAF